MYLFIVQSWMLGWMCSPLLHYIILVFLLVSSYWKIEMVVIRKSNWFPTFYKIASNNKSPPSLSSSKSFTDWLKLIDIWRRFTNLEPGKQGPAIVLSLEGKAQDAILELDTGVISGTDGVDKILERLNRLYKKDEVTKIWCLRVIRNIQAQL